MRAGLRNHRFTQIHTDSRREGRRDGAARLDRFAIAARPPPAVLRSFGSGPSVVVLAPGVRIAILLIIDDGYRYRTDGFRCISGIRIHHVNICIHPFLVVEDFRANRPGERGRGERTGGRSLTDGSRGRAQRRESAAAAQRPPGPRSHPYLRPSVCICGYGNSWGNLFRNHRWTQIHTDTGQRGRRDGASP
jgi:hypothetical protein